MSVLGYVLGTWPWKWRARRRWIKHAVTCGQCRLVVKAGLPPGWLCDEGFVLGRQANDP